MLRRHPPLLLAAFAAGVLGWIGAEPPTARANPEVQITTAADCAVLVVTTDGGMVRWSSVVEIFGDGRMVGRTGMGGGRNPMDSFETRIPRAELVELITDLAEWNVLEKEWEVLPAVRSSRRVTDAASVLVDVRLTRYKERRVKPNRSIQIRFGGYALHNAIAEHPEVLELVAIGRLLGRVEELVLKYRKAPGERRPSD